MNWCPKCECWYDPQDDRDTCTSDSALDEWTQDHIDSLIREWEESRPLDYPDDPLWFLVPSAN